MKKIMDHQLIYFKKFMNKNFSESIKPSTFKFKTGVAKIPHYSKKDKGGEDAYACTDQMIAVADGVGGWNEQGIDPSKFSNELCNNIKKQYYENFFKHFSKPKSMFVNAVQQTKAIGSATFCMITIDVEKQYIHTVNLGDSGYMLIRKEEHLQNINIDKKEKNNNEAQTNIDINGKKSNGYKLIFKSEEQQHSFNFPFQCGTHGDNPESAVTNVHNFQENDLLILATDGLWDNLYETQIIGLVDKFFELSKDKEDMNALSNFIGTTAENISLDQRYKSPFYQRSGNLYLGGKPDDVTVVVSKIVKNSFEPKF